jgi:hypothetical protein
VRRRLLAAAGIVLLAGCRGGGGDRPVLGLWSGRLETEGAPQVTRVRVSGDARALLLRHRDRDLTIRLEGEAPAAFPVKVSDVERGAPRLVTSETVPGGRFRHELHLKKEDLGEASFIALGFDRPGLVVDTLELVEEGARPPLVVIGLDGLTWRILDPLLSAGKLPHFRKLIDSGVSGVLLSEKPMLSPVVWTTIATGRPHTDHGIHDFFDAEGHLVNSTQVKTKRIWELAGGPGRATVGVVGWFVSWPVERTAGPMLSDRATEWKPNDKDRPASFHPPELQAPFEDLVNARLATYLDECRRFTPLELPADWKTRFAPGSPEHKRISELDTRLLRVFLRDSSFVEASLRLSTALHPELQFLYLRGSDNVQHAFWFQRAPEESLTPVAEEEKRLFGGTIDAYYQWLDESLGRLVAAATPGTTFMVVSDHGFRSIVREKNGEKRQVAYHERQGVFIASGPAFRKGTKIEPISVLDLVPIWLQHLGLPPAADMPGRVPAEIYAKAPVKGPRLASYGNRSEGSVSRTTEADEGIVEQLKALGYVQ